MGLHYRQIAKHGEAVAKHLMPAINQSLDNQTSDIINRMRVAFPSLTAPPALPPPPPRAAVEAASPAINPKAADRIAKAAAAKEARQVKAKAAKAAKAKAVEEAALAKAIARANAKGLNIRIAE